VATVEAVETLPATRPAGAWRIALRRLKRDKVAMASAATLVLVLVACFAGGPIVSKLVGHGPDDIFPYAARSQKPAGPWTHVANTSVIESLDPNSPQPKKFGTTLLVLGADGTLGRDELLRVLYGGRVTLGVAFGGALLALLIGLVLGSIAGYFGGFVDTVISRFTDLVMTFPLLLFVVAIGYTATGDRLTEVTFGDTLPKGVVALILLIGLFTWFYPARIVRTEILALRQREFVEAATASGASSAWILRRHLYPHVVPSLLVWGAIAVATNIMLEAGVTFLGAGIRIPTASWGSLLASTWGSLANPQLYNPVTFSQWPTIVPTIAILVTVVALNQLGESLRSVLDPRAIR
jgi:peptide/nickel transport system permease protein